MGGCLFGEARVFGRIRYIKTGGPRVLPWGTITTTPHHVMFRFKVVNLNKGIEREKRLYQVCKDGNVKCKFNVMFHCETSVKKRVTIKQCI